MATDQIGPKEKRTADHPVTPEGRYFVVCGRLWRLSNPALSPETRDDLVKNLMRARRAVGEAMKGGDIEAESEARRGARWIAPSTR